MCIYVYNFDTKFDSIYVRKLNPLEERQIRRKDEYGVVKNGKTLYLKERNDELAMDIIKKHLNDQIIELNAKINRFKQKIELCNDSDNIKILDEHSYNKDYYERCLLRESILKNSK